MNFENPLARAALLGGAMALAGCGGGDSVGVGSGPGVTGVAAKGLMAGTTVEVFPVGEFGFADTENAPLATVVTNQLGQFNLPNRPNPGLPLILRTRGGSYLDESDPAPLADKRRIVFGNDEGFEALLPAGQTTVAITPYSQMLLERARLEAEPGRFIDFFDVIRQRVTGVLGFDPVSDLPADPINPAGASAASRNYAMALGGFAQQINSTAIRLRVQPSFAVLSAVQVDLRDGVLDGQDQGDPLSIDVGNGPEPLPVFDFNQQIERFRNNNFGAYGGAAAIVFDEDVLSGPITIDNTPPLVDNFAASVEQGGTLSVAPPGLLDGTSDIDGDTLTVETTPVSGPQSGQLTLNSDGSFEYVHNGSAGTTDSFTFAVIDGNGGRTVATATITIIPQAANRLYNTAFLELTLVGNDAANAGEFRVFQDRGFYDISTGNDPQANVVFGPFESRGEVAIQSNIFQGQEGTQQFDSLFFDEGGGIDGTAESETLTRAADGVLIAEPLFEQNLFNFEVQFFEREQEDGIILVPVRDDFVVTALNDRDTNFRAISANEAPQGAYLDGSFTGRISQEFDVALEFGLQQSTNFNVSLLQGDYGFAGMEFFIEPSGRQTISAYRIENSPGADGIANGETIEFNDMIYTPDGLGGGSTTTDFVSQTDPASSTEYVAEPNGRLAITYRENGVLEGTPTGLASPDGEIVIIQEFLVEGGGQQQQANSVSSTFQVGVRRAGGTVNLEGRRFRLSQLFVERSANDQENAVVQFTNAPLDFGSTLCTIDLRIGQNAAAATRLGDAGPVLVDADDDGMLDRQDCSFSTGPQGTVTITVPGDQQDPNGSTYTGYIGESGDVMVLQFVRDEGPDGFFQRGMAIAYADNDFTTPDNLQPTISVSPPSATVGLGQTLDLNATIADPDAGANLSIQWFSTIGAFTAPTSVDTQWIAPSNTAGTTLLTAVVSDGQLSRVVDVPVTFGQENLQKATGVQYLGLRDAEATVLLTPDEFDFLFHHINPFDTVAGNYSCPGDGGQTPPGTIVQDPGDNDSSGSLSVGDTPSIQFTDCVEFDLVRNGTVSFSITNVFGPPGQSTTEYTATVDYNESVGEDNEFVTYSGQYDVQFNMDQVNTPATEVFVVSADSDFSIVINLSGTTAGPIARGLDISVRPASNIRYDLDNDLYTAILNYDATFQPIVNDQPSGSPDVAFGTTPQALVGLWEANIPGGAGTEVGLQQGLGTPFQGQLTLIPSSVSQAGPGLQNYRLDFGGNVANPSIQVAFDPDQDGVFDTEVDGLTDVVFGEIGFGGNVQGVIDQRGVTTDGNTAEWGGRAPDAAFRRGEDIENDNDILGVYVALDGNDLVFRMDVAGNFDPQNRQYDFVYVPYNESQSDCEDVTVDFDAGFADPANSEFCHLFVSDGFPNGAHNGCGTGLASLPTRAGGLNGSVEAAVAFGSQQPTGATHLKVFYGSVVRLPNFDQFVQAVPPFCVALP